MRKNRRWLWIVLFIWMALLVGTLATGWNVVLVKDYNRLVELAQTFSLPAEIRGSRGSLIFAITAGTLGFAAILGTLVLFFIKLLREMRLNQQQAEFLATVSHELKTPIASIELSGSLLRNGGLNPGESETLWETHARELKRLKEEVEALLEAARWQNRPNLVKPAPVLLENWLTDSLARWRSILGPNARIERKGEPLHARAFVDPKTLNLITDNLVDNARKFSKNFPDVIVTTRRIPPGRPWQRPRWQIQIEDHGWGFDPQDSKRIFNRFFRGKTEAPIAIPGTGLGLYLASSASRALGITLRGESPGRGQGAVFTLEGRENR